MSLKYKYVKKEWNKNMLKEFLPNSFKNAEKMPVFSLVILNPNCIIQYAKKVSAQVDIPGLTLNEI